MRWLCRWFDTKPGPRARVVLYTRAGCHLCLEAGEVLVKYKGRFNFALDVVDVDTSSDLVDRFGQIVPAVTINGRVRFRGRVNEPLLRRLLAVAGGPTTLTGLCQDGGGSAGPL